MEDKLAMYEDLIPLTGIGIWEHDLINNKSYYNDIVYRILEIDQEQSFTFVQSIAFHKYPDLVHHLIARAKESLLPETMVSQLTTPEGKLKWVRIRVKAVQIESECSKISGTLEDITNQINVVLKLQSRDQRFTNAFHHAPNGMALVSLTGYFTKVNLSLSTIFGYDKKLLLKLNYQQLVHDEDLEKIIDMISCLTALEKRTDQAEVRFRHHQGHYIWTMLNISIVHDDAGQPNYLIFQLKDIDERIKNQQVINAQNKRLKNFAHITSHNLRSYGSNINALAELALNEPDPAETTQLISMLKNSSTRLLETLEQLNEIVKVQQYSLLSSSSIPVVGEIQRVLDILSASINETAAVIKVDISGSEQLNFNASYFESIIINLLTNAIKYRHPDRPPYIEITMQSNQESKTLFISDNGIGIDMERHKEKIFGLYNTFHTHPDSRGVGLYLVKQQLEELGGEINIESKPGYGTRFALSFPTQ
ncbi:MAG: PAS domain S-box protein [Pedobacter sp.]|nr:MAG: PAS domain S-box protein [Pedobacter sp.]